MYGKVSPLDFKTQVISTSDANADPVFQDTRVEEFNGLLHNDIFEVGPRQQADGYCITQDALSVKLRISAPLGIVLKVDLFYATMATRTTL